MVMEGYEVHVACRVNGELSSNLHKSVIVHNIEYPLSFIAIIKLFESLRNMNKIISKNKFICVINHNRIASFVGRISSYYCRVKYNVYFAHGFYFHDDQKKISRLLSVYLEKYLAHITSFTLSQSKDDMDYMTLKSFIDKDKIAYVANGINDKKFNLFKKQQSSRDEIGLPKKDFIICAVGRLVKGKGFQDLIEAFKMINDKNKDTHLLIIGGNVKQDISKFQKQIFKLIKLYKIENKVTLTGMVDNVEDYLGCSNLFISSSYREGISRSLLEAMSMGLPSIATRIRGSKEVIKNMHNGLLYEPKNINDLIENIEKIIKNEDLQKKLSVNAVETVKSFYTEEMYTIRQMNVINNLINRN